MTFKIIKCEEPTVNCFCNHLKQEGVGVLTSLEDSKQKRKQSIIIGKIVRVISTLNNTSCVTILVKEVLPNYEYGEKFKAVIHKQLAQELIRFVPEVGDRLAFFEPFIVPNTAFGNNIITGKKPPRFLLEIGGTENSLMWCAKKKWVFVKKSDSEEILKLVQNHLEKNTASKIPEQPKEQSKEKPQNQKQSKETLSVVINNHSVATEKRLQTQAANAMQASCSGQRKDMQNIGKTTTSTLPNQKIHEPSQINKQSKDMASKSSNHPLTTGKVTTNANQAGCSSRTKDVQSTDKATASTVPRHNLHDTTQNQIESEGMSSKSNNHSPSTGKQTEMHATNPTQAGCSGQIKDVQNTGKEPVSIIVHQKSNVVSHKPQIANHTQKTQPRYNYKALADIKSAALSGDLERVNLFGVVHQVTKVLTKTSTGKYTIICKIVDESTDGFIHFDLHFFIPDNTILKQIQQGDVLRLHRVKMELYNDDADGRLFSNLDIVLFKKDCPNVEPVTNAKSYILTDHDKKRVLELHKWFVEFEQREFSQIVCLRDICKQGVYYVVCQVLADAVEEDSRVIMKVTDGTQTKQLTPSTCLKGSHPSAEKIVTQIVAYVRQFEYLKLKEGDFAFFRQVKVIEVNNELHLKINTNVVPQLMNKNNEKVKEIIRRLEEYNTQNNAEVGDEITSVEVPNGSVDRTNNHQTVEDTSRKCPHETTGYFGNERYLNNCEDKGPLFWPCGNRSCIKLREKEKKTGKCDAKNKDVLNKVDNAEVKGRRQLFTLNYNDLSDATDETNETLETLTQFRTEVNKDTTTVVVTPANTSFGDLIELVKSKYCSPRKITQESPKEELNRLTESHESEKKTEENLINTQPVVKLVKLTEDQCRSLTSQAETEERCLRSSTRARKRRLDGAEQSENMDDASTVINISAYTNTKKNRQRNKRMRIDSESTVLGEDVESLPRPIISSEVLPLDTGEKVSSWLYHKDNYLVQRPTDYKVDDIDTKDVSSILLGEHDKSPDLSSYLNSKFLRMKVFLVNVTPEPHDNQLNLVSGYCYSGCRQMSLYSTIHWQSFDNGGRIPCCPLCMRLQREKQVELMLFFELRVLDCQGCYTSVLVCREQAETFLNCTVFDFVNDAAIRTSRVQLLTDYTIQNSMHTGHTPLLDLSITMLGKYLFLAGSTLKLPSSP